MYFVGLHLSKPLDLFVVPPFLEIQYLLMFKLFRLGTCCPHLKNK